MAILFNCSNLHVGGGIQVATSVIYEFSKMTENELEDIHLVISTEIFENLDRLGADLSVFESFRVYDTFGISAFLSPLNKEIAQYSLVVTPFGPNYLRKKGNVELVGFAQAWMLKIASPVFRNLGFMEGLKLRAKLFLQWLFFRRSDHYIVELEHVKNGLQAKGISEFRIDVIHNSISSLYLDPEVWRSVKVDKKGTSLSLGIVSRGYLHKNLAVLPRVAEILHDRYNLEVHFYVTLNEVEWKEKSCFFKKHVTTVGSVYPDQCPFFYQAMDGVIFPSLLECFSVTPLEALVMQKPLFASDRGFVRDICGDHAFYFDPLDAESIASTIAGYFSVDIDRTSQLEAGREHALNFSSAKERAIKYLETIKKLSNG